MSTNNLDENTFSLSKMRSEIHKLKPEDLEETIIEKSITHSGTNGPNETSIRDQRGVSTYLCTNETCKILLGISQTTFKKKHFEYLIEKMQLCHFTDDQLNNLKAILIDHRDEFTDDQWKKVFHLISEKRLNDEQFGIFVDMLDTSTQKSALLHASGGTGKTFVTCKILEELALRNEICCCTCPTGVGGLHLPQGQNFHSVFRTWTPNLSAGSAIDEMFKSLGGNQLKMVVVDEVSMLSAQFLVLLDTRLQSMYNSDQKFGVISILLIGDFIQLPVTTGCDFLSVMYGTVSGNNGTACDLFQQFCVKKLTANIQTSECKIHTQRVAGFRTLPQVYLSGQKWAAEDNKLYKPITKDIVDGVTHELTL